MNQPLKSDIFYPSFRILHLTDRRTSTAVSRVVMHFPRHAPVFPLAMTQNDDAADMSELSAAMSPMQRHTAVFPPASSVISAALREHPACQCSGKLSSV
ncbi:MAG: hypothetical protein R3E39_04085 [Anaerolineae bacterium]